MLALSSLSFWGLLGILVLIALLVATVIVVPLFYTLVTRWAFSGGSPRPPVRPAPATGEAAPQGISKLDGTAPVTPASKGAASAAAPSKVEEPGETTKPPTVARLETGSVPLKGDEGDDDVGSTENGRPGEGEADAPVELPKGARIDPKLGLVYDRRPEDSDDLTKIKGVAGVLEAKLHSYGVFTFRQIAGWNDQQMADFGVLLAFKDRIQRDDWRGQCRALDKEKKTGS